MTTTTAGSSAAVDVTEAMRQADADVFAEARRKFARDLEQYRAGVILMSQRGGMLPPDEAARLLEACRSLGIPPERLDADVGHVLEHDGLTTRVEAIQVRNAARLEPIPRLEAELKAAQRDCSKVREECEPRIQAAIKRVDDARRAAEAAQRVRLETTDREERDIMHVRDRAPHLFGPVEPAQLRRIVSPDRRGIFD